MVLRTHPSWAGRAGTGPILAVLSAAVAIWLAACATDGPAGDTLLFSATLRGAAADGSPGQVYVRVQQNADPWPAVLERDVRLTEDWAQVTVPVRSSLSIPAAVAVATFHLAFAAQTVEIANVALVNYGPDRDPLDLPGGRSTYAGREPHAAWRAPAAARIEQHRKAPISVSVVDAGGRAVDGAQVTVAQTRHFGFGSVVSPPAVTAAGHDGDRYRETVARYFNKAPLENALRWQNWHPLLPDHGQRAEVDRTLDWLVEHDIEDRGHHLLWGPVHDNSKPVSVSDPGRMREEHDRHMDAKIAYVGDRVGEWDAINHIVGWGETWESLFGREDYLRVMARARELVPPGVELWIDLVSPVVSPAPVHPNPEGSSAAGLSPSHAASLRTHAASRPPGPRICL